MESPAAAPRKIIHVDMDAFYASVEQRDDPALRGRPVAVGGARERGVVAAASYEARTYGVRSAMPSVTARRLCPELIFVKPRFEIYKAVSNQIREIFALFTDLIEPLSLDEAYLDVTADKAGIGSARDIAEAIRSRIRAETGLTASAGVSYNKFLAKLASDYDKPDGLFVVRPSQGEAFVAALPVARFHGIGPVTAARMARLGIHTGADLRSRSLVELQEQFGKSASYYYWAARGRDDRPVRPDRIRKSLGAETTFFDDLLSEQAMVEALDGIAATVWRRAEQAGAFGRTVTLKLKYNDFRIVTRARSLPQPVLAHDALHQAGVELLRPLCPVSRGVRLLGLTLSSFDRDEADPEPQLALAL
jgi:DNA polymerase-4